MNLSALDSMRYSVSKNKVENNSGNTYGSPLHASDRAYILIDTHMNTLHTEKLTHIQTHKHTCAYSAIQMHTHTQIHAYTHIHSHIHIYAMQ